MCIVPVAGRRSQAPKGWFLLTPETGDELRHIAGWYQLGRRRRRKREDFIEALLHAIQSRPGSLNT
jgi:hypothetical protein